MKTVQTFVMLVTLLSTTTVVAQTAIVSSPSAPGQSIYIRPAPQYPRFTNPQDAHALGSLIGKLLRPIVRPMLGLDSDMDIVADSARRAYANAPHHPLGGTPPVLDRFYQDQLEIGALEERLITLRRRQREIMRQDGKGN